MAWSETKELGDGEWVQITTYNVAITLHSPSGGEPTIQVSNENGTPQNGATVAILGENGFYNVPVGPRWLRVTGVGDVLLHGLSRA